MSKYLKTKVKYKIIELMFIFINNNNILGSGKSQIDILNIAIWKVKLLSLEDINSN